MGSKTKLLIAGLIGIVLIFAGQAFQQNRSVMEHELQHASSCHDLGGNASIQAHGLVIGGYPSEASSTCTLPGNDSLSIDTKRLLDSQNEQTGYPMFVLNDSLGVFALVNLVVSLMIGYVILEKIEQIKR